MHGCNISDKLARQQVKEGLAKEAWIKEQVKFEIDRLKAVLGDVLATDEENSIAQSQIANYQDMAAMIVRPIPGWLQQMDLLADPGEDYGPMPAGDDSPSLAPSTLTVRSAREVALVKNHDHNGEDKRPLLLGGPPQSFTGPIGRTSFPARLGGSARTNSRKHGPLCSGGTFARLLRF